MHTGVMSVRSWDRRRGSLEELERVGACSYRKVGVKRDVEGA